MGRRGPIPFDDRRRSLLGLPRARKQRLKLSPRAPRPPTWLDQEARAEWRRVVPGLDRLGVLAEVDRAILTAYCCAWSRYVDASRALQASGFVVAGYRGAERKHPLYPVCREAGVLVRELAKELYLTPAARMRAELPAGLVEDVEPDEIL